MCATKGNYLVIVEAIGRDKEFPITVLFITSHAERKIFNAVADMWLKFLFRIRKVPNLNPRPSYFIISQLLSF
jgi:hypothetical protein